MSVFILIALFSVCRWLAGYPLQCSYTIKAKAPGAPLLNRLAAASVYAIVDIVLISAYWMYVGHAFSLVLLGEAGVIALGARFALDYAKFNLFPQFKVASQAEFAQIAEDYKSKDPAVVAAAQAKSDSNKYFWWMTGAFGSICALVDISIAYLIQ